MDKKLLKYWKNCLLDAERRSRSLTKEARVTLRIGDKLPEFILRKDIPLLFPKGKQKENDEKRKIQIQYMPQQSEVCIFVSFTRFSFTYSFSESSRVQKVQ